MEERMSTALIIFIGWGLTVTAIMCFMIVGSSDDDN